MNTFSNEPGSTQGGEIPRELDVIVIGAGFAGITAARQLRKQGKRTLILEARDRIGGRTWTDTFAGKRIERGGTWIQPKTQPFVAAELERYGIRTVQDDSIFSDDWWFDNGENVAHTVLGVAGVTAAYVFPANLHRPLVLLIGALGIFFGVYNLFSEEFLGSDLQNPFDTILHFAVGGWALFSAWYRRPMGSAGGAP